MPQYVFTMNKVGKVVPPKKVVLRDISLSFFPGAKIGVLGINGSGKSTLLNIMAGLDKEFDGEAKPMSNLKVGHFSQEPNLDHKKTVRDTVEEGLSEVLHVKKELAQVYEAYASPDADFDALAERQAKLEALLSGFGADIDQRLDVASDALRLPDWNKKISTLSGGEKRRVALCRLLLSSPDMLLLDEPTNHLDAESVRWLEQFLHRFSGTVVAITHDRYFLDNVAEWILELDRGHGIPWRGNYSSWLNQKEKRLAQEEKKESVRMRTIRKELIWMRESPKARRGKNKARITRFEELSSLEFQRRNETQEIFIPVADRLGKDVINFSNVSKGYSKTSLFQSVSFTIPPGAIVGVIGPNGAGKTTLFNLVAGKDLPDTGVIKIGKTVNLAYIDQNRYFPKDEKSVWETLSNGQDLIKIGKFEMSSRAYLSRFNFKGPDQQKALHNLSGGEIGRLHLAKTLIKGANVLLLDEPSNDLDVETLRALEEALMSFAGTVLVTSHDRWFLDRVCTHILAFEGNSEVVFFSGNYQEYELDKIKRLGEEKARPSRIKFKQL